MCGIAGFLGTTSQSARLVLASMVEALGHRGPDAGGMHLEAGIALGHRRLSIVDLEGGAQPFRTADGNHWVSFNGEIFNHVELRARLAARGHPFRTHSDTETLLEQYVASGPNCVQSFIGDFAFALWDRPRRRLMLARDRMGVRPLFYTFVRGTLVFASEIKALLRFPGVTAQLDPVALDQTFTFWFPLAPRTPFRGVMELPPGHLLLAEPGGLSVRPYWRLQFPEANDASPSQRNEEDAAAEVAELMHDATRIRLRADVPVGAYLSGGFDSSATTALARQANSASLRTFSVGFRNAAFDESAYQRMVVDALQTEHTSVLCGSEDIGRVFPDVIRHTERPVIRTAPAPLYLLSRLVRDSGCKVVLTGEGADEVFAGYDIFKEAQVRRFWARRPESRWRPLLLSRLYPYLSDMQSQPASYLKAFFGSGLELAGDALFSHLPRFMLTRRISRFYSERLRAELDGYDALEELRSSLPPDYARWHTLSQAQYLESAHLLPGYILSSQGDRMAMAHGVEGRFPFLDHRVVELAAKLPPRMKLKGLEEKSILRRALGPLVPEAVTRRPKQPYRAPESECFAGPAAPDYAKELLSREAITRAGWFDAASVSKLVDKCARGGRVGTADNMALVGILSVQLLDQLFVSGPDRTATSEATCHEAPLVF